MGQAAAQGRPRPGRRRRPQGLEQQVGPVVGLQIVDSLVAGATQAAREAEPLREAPRTAVRLDPVEPWPGAGELGERRRGQQGDRRLGVGGADAVERGEGEDHVAESAQLDDQNPPRRGVHRPADAPATRRCSVIARR